MKTNKFISYQLSVVSRQLLVKLFVFTFVFLLLSFDSFSQVGINIDGTTPDNSAGLDVKFSNKGMLVPRMNTAQMNTISSPATGLTIFNTDCYNFYYNAGTPSAKNWVAANPSPVLGTPGLITGPTTVSALQAGVTSPYSTRIFSRRLRSPTPPSISWCATRPSTSGREFSPKRPTASSARPPACCVPVGSCGRCSTRTWNTASRSPSS